jgi:hypothetical protein
MDLSERNMSYNIIYNDIYCFNQLKIIDKDTFIINTQKVYKKNKYFLGKTELKNCNCKSFSNSPNWRGH